MQEMPTVDENKKRGNLSVEEAQKEANVQRAAVERYTQGERQPTAKDYEQALDAIKFLQEISMKDPMAAKYIMDVLAGISIATSKGLEVLMHGLSSVIALGKEERAREREQFSKGIGTLGSDYEEKRKIWSTNSEIAREALETLKKEAEKFTNGGQETEQQEQ